MTRFDVAVIGAGAAGMMCAAIAGQRGRSVCLLDHARHPGEKIRISGGGRCNFTNTYTQPEHFISADPAFCRHALLAYTPEDFIGLVRRHRIGFHEKHKGQLFCDESSNAIIAMLRAECDAGAVRWLAPARIDSVAVDGKGYRLMVDGQAIAVQKVVIATGGLSIPKIGSTDFGYRLARQFGLGVIEPRPGLVPLTFDGPSWSSLAALAGVSLPVRIHVGPSSLPSVGFDEDLLFTHRGLSGPAVLQISSYWEPGEALCVDLAPGIEIGPRLRAVKDSSRQDLLNVLAQWLPRRFAQGWTASQVSGGEELVRRKIAEIPNKSIDLLANAVKSWKVVPSGTEGFKKAEVTRGGVDTRALSPTTMEVKSQPGLYFIGEVVDVTGWLGGYNFQWAWASAAAAGRSV